MRCGPWIPGLLLFASFPAAARAAVVSGVVHSLDDPQNTISNARMTLFTSDLAFFREARTGSTGAYAFANVPAGGYRLGCAAVGRDYLEDAISVGAGTLTRDFALGLLSHPGTWEIVGTTLPEFFDATDIGLVLPDGRILYCHDTTDPILFDPVTGSKSFPSSSPSEQGCMNGTLLEDGRVIMVGGQDGADPGSFRNAIPWVKSYSPALDEWTLLPSLQLAAGRWYPGMARLADGSLLVMGGGTAPNAQRTATCERLDLETLTWSYTGSLLNPSEFSPAALLFTGDVLATWSPPQLYRPATGQWRATGNFNQPNRMWPGHSDHSLVVLADGRALAIGVIAGPDGNAVMGEVFDPGTETWRLTSNPGLLRFQAEVTQLPDGQILVAGGETEADTPPVPDVLGIVRWCDLYDPTGDAWRRVADMNWYREYHAVTLLVPDGRVLTTGGTRIKFQVGPTSADIEAYSPPYLFRGVRPQITSLSVPEPERGSTILIGIAPQTSITSAVLMGVQSTTHWVECGVPRRLVLPVQQQGSQVSLDLPADPHLLPLGYYMLFAMVDDIPSVARIIKVVPRSQGTGVEPAEATSFRLVGSWPSPAPGAAHLRYDLASSSRVQLSIYDIRGRLVRRLVAGAFEPPGGHTAFWDGRDGLGRAVPAGVYMVALRAAGRSVSGRVILSR